MAQKEVEIGLPNSHPNSEAKALAKRLLQGGQKRKSLQQRNKNRSALRLRAMRVAVQEELNLAISKSNSGLAGRGFSDLAHAGLINLIGGLVGSCSWPHRHLESARNVQRDSPNARVLRGPAVIGHGSRYEQPVKSISFGVTVVPGLTFNGFPFASTLMVCDGGVQSVAPPLIGMNAFAPTEYSTLPEAGAE